MVDNDVVMSKREIKFKPTILLLNSDMTPISIISNRRGVKLIYKGRVEMLEYDTNNPILTENLSINRPKVIRLLEYSRIPYRRINLSKQNLFKRDGLKCVYCESDDNLTIDHVVPRCRGGKNVWENLVTCCFRCNKKKGRKTPEESNMKLKYQPFYPSQNYYMVNMVSGFNEEWKKFFK